MIETDILQRFIFEKASVRGEIVRLGSSYQTITQQHQYPPLIRNLLGEILVVAALLSASIKFKGRITVQFQGKGDLKLLLAQCNQHLELRGLAQWQSTLTEAALVSQLQQGVLGIIMDPDSSAGNRYQGVVEWRGTSLASSIEGYFAQSEQVPTRIWLAVDETKAAGLLIQVMPRESVRLGKDTFEDKDWEHISHLSSTITPHELLNLDNQTILQRLYALDEVRIFDKSAVMFRCACSKKRSEDALRLLGIDEVNEELHQKQVVAVKCEFCSQEYIFDRVDIASIFKQGDGSSPAH